MPRKPDLGNVQLYPNRPLRAADRNGYVLKFYCPLRGQRIRKSCGTRDRREARRIQRECRERLLNGQYVASDGAITRADAERSRPAGPLPQVEVADHETTWDEACEHYREHMRRRRRGRSSRDAESRIDIAGRIFEARRANAGLPPGAALWECTTLEALEYLQNQLLDGAEGFYDTRSPNSVNSMVGAVMAFVRYCHDHEWIDRVPPLRKLDVDEMMRGRPITGEEFERMLAATAKVVGDGPAASWQFALRVLWESGFRIGDLMNFSWDDERRIHPVWPRRRSEHATLVIPSTQKNRKHEEIPMLPGLRALLEQVPETQRTGCVADPLPVEFEMKSQASWWMPAPDDLEVLAREFSNCAIARACGVSEQTVRNWLKRLALQRQSKIARYGEEIPASEVARLRTRAARRTHQSRRARLTTERVSRIIAGIGEEAGVVVRQSAAENGVRVKYASAHDLRRSLAERLINAGVSAETLMVIMRHRDFATTRKFYGAMKVAQSAAEIHRKLDSESRNSAFVGGFVGGQDEAPRLSAEELQKLKRLLGSL